MNISVNKVAEILKKNHLEPSILRRIIEEMNLAVQPDSLDEEKPPATKKQFVILVSDPEGRFPKNDFVGWVLQIPDTESCATTEERVFRAAYEYNASKKGRMYPAKTVGEAIENIPAKFFKESEVWVKTKVPILVLKTDNDIPKEKESEGDIGRRVGKPVEKKEESLTDLMMGAAKSMSEAGIDVTITHVPGLRA